MNIFNSLKTYAASWNVKETRGFSAEEIDAVKSAEVVASQYGTSCCFMMKAGGSKFIPMSRDASAAVGQSIDLTKAKLVVLSKDGEADILRVEA